MAGNIHRGHDAAMKSILTFIPVASAIFSRVLSVKPSYSPFSIREIACWLVPISLASSC